MTGLNSDDVPLANRPWDSRMDSTAGGHRGHTRQESTSSDSAMLDKSFKDQTAESVPQQTVYPSEQTSGSNRHYSDPYYRGTGYPS